MKRFRSFAGSLLAGLALTNCQDVVELNVPAGDVLLAVDGAITDQPVPCVVKLTQTAPYFTNQAAPPVTGAVVELADNAGGRETLREQAPGVYVTTGPLRGRVGGHYVLTIAARGEQYQAETEIRRAPAIDSVRARFREASGVEEAGYSILYYGQEAAGRGDYYRFQLYRNGVLRNGAEELNVQSDELVDGNYLRGLDLNRGFEGTADYKPGDRVRVAVQSLPADYYYFLREVATQITNEGLFAASPANVRTNVRNVNPNSPHKAVGYFAGYSVRSDSTVIR